MGTANDVLKNALENEVKAAAFYNLAAKVTPDDEIRMLFIELAGMEDGHSRDFMEKAAGTALTDGFNAEAYLDELESSMEDTAKIEHNDLFESGDMNAVLDFAIGIETHARDTYQVMASLVDDPAIKKFCAELSAEEEEHRMMLELAKTSLSMEMEDRPAL